MKIIIEKNVPYKSIYEGEVIIEIDLDNIERVCDDIIEDKVLAIYKVYVEKNVDLVILTNLEVVTSLQLEGVHVCYVKQGEVDGNI